MVSHMVSSVTLTLRAVRRFMTLQRRSVTKSVHPAAGCGILAPFLFCGDRRDNAMRIAFSELFFLLFSLIRSLLSLITPVGVIVIIVLLVMLMQKVDNLSKKQ